MIGFEPEGEVCVTVRQIEGVELLLGVRFPKEYRKLIQTHNGAYGDADFPLAGAKEGEDAASIGVWLSLLPWDSESVWGHLISWTERDIDKRVVPFGMDGGGNLICFDYRTGDEPKISFWWHDVGGEEAFWPVTDSFARFVALLSAPDE